MKLTILFVFAVTFLTLGNGMEPDNTTTIRSNRALNEKIDNLKTIIDELLYSGGKTTYRPTEQQCMNAIHAIELTFGLITLALFMTYLTARFYIHYLAYQYGFRNHTRDAETMTREEFVLNPVINNERANVNTQPN